MTGTQRREAVLEAIRGADSPVRGGDLARAMGVSRQVIVQDVALLRTSGHDIVSTNRGYVLVDPQADAAREHGRPSRLIKVRHTVEQTREELDAIVDLGAAVESVMVNHRTYGRMEAPLNLRSRRDVTRFLEDLAAGVSSPLMTITDGYHFHLVSADSDEVLDEVEDALDKLGFLAPLTEFEQDAFAQG